METTSYDDSNGSSFRKHSETNCLSQYVISYASLFRYTYKTLSTTGMAIEVYDFLNG